MRSVIVNRGSKDNIELGMAVMDKSYLIGKVVEVSFTSSRVLLLSDLNSKVPVDIMPNNIQSILSGTGDDNGTIQYTRQQELIENDAIVFTSGAGGLFKSGIPIGTIFKDPNNSDINVVAINDLGNYENLAYLLKHDSVMGILDSDVRVDGDNLLVEDRVIKLTSIKDPAELPWSELDVDVVIESTGIFRDNESLNKHLAAGAKKVLLTVPPKDEIDATIVLGVNDEDLKPDDKIVSNASCTTNCLAPIAKVLDDNFGIKSGLMTTVPVSYTHLTLPTKRIV